MACRQFIVGPVWTPIISHTSLESQSTSARSLPILWVEQQVLYLCRLQPSMCEPNCKIHQTSHFVLNTAGNQGISSQFYPHMFVVQPSPASLAGHLAFLFVIECGKWSINLCFVNKLNPQRTPGGLRKKTSLQVLKTKLAHNVLLGLRVHISGSWFRINYPKISQSSYVVR